MTQPLTRDVREVAQALAIVEAELGFQFNRLRDRTSGSTEQESEHLNDLMSGYGVSRRYVRLLRKYHEGRIERQAESGSLGMEGSGPSGIDARGRSAAQTTEEGP